MVRRGGRIHLSVPFGRREDHGWFRQLDRADVDELFERAHVGRREEAVFLYGAAGWRRASVGEAAASINQPAFERAADLAVAARAVLCAIVYAPD